MKITTDMLDVQIVGVRFIEPAIVHIQNGLDESSPYEISVVIFSKYYNSITQAA
jgi:hypothetical protein